MSLKRSAVGAPIATNWPGVRAMTWYSPSANQAVEAGLLGQPAGWSANRTSTALRIAGRAAGRRIGGGAGRATAGPPAGRGATEPATPPLLDSRGTGARRRPARATPVSTGCLATSREAFGWTGPAGVAVAPAAINLGQ